MEKLTKEQIVEVLDNFKLIKALTNSIEPKVLELMLEYVSFEKGILPLINPSQFINTNKDFYSEIEGMVKLIQNIKSFNLHLIKLGVNKLQ